MPKFPYPLQSEREIGRLFGLDRKDRTARNLGLSSITRGEGSLDLYETDGGPVRARYGDLPDGSFGVGVTHRGAFWNVSDLIGAGEDRDDAQDDRMDGHASRLGSAENRLGTAEGRLDGHASRLGSAEGRLDDHAGRLGSAENRLGDAEGRLNSHASRLGSAENRLDSHASRIGSTENRLDGHDSTLSSHNSRINAARDRADSAYSQAQSKASPQMVQNLQDYVEDLNRLRQVKEAQLEARIAALEAWRASLPGN